MVVLKMFGFVIIPQDQNLLNQDLALDIFFVTCCPKFWIAVGWILANSSDFDLRAV